MTIVCLFLTHCSKEVHVKEDHYYHINVEEAIRVLRTAHEDVS